MTGGNTTLPPQETMRWTRIGILSAFAMALGFLETFIPIPIPGVKLGLANIAILIALAQDDLPGAFCVGCIKVLAAGLLFGNPVTMAYSAAGTLAAFLVMAPLSRLRTLRLEMLSVAGAVAHGAGQLAVAMVLLGTPLVWYSAPVLLVAGCITGLLCGIVAARVVALLEEGADVGGSVSLDREEPPLALRDGGDSLDPRIAIVVFLCYCVALLHASTPAALGIGLLVALLACFAGRVQMRTLLATLRPLALILVITLVAQIASFQQGHVLALLGPVALTAEALEAAGIMCVRLLGITASSVALMGLVSTSGLIGAISWLLAPLRHLGLRTEGPVLALQVALQTVPMLAQTIRDQAATWKEQGITREWLRTTVPQFIAACYRTLS